MKRTLWQMGALLLAFSMSTHTFAQTISERQKISSTYNLSKLQQLKTDFQSKAQSKKQQALQMAAANGWETVRMNDDGSFDELISVTRDGQPIYYSIYNEDAARSTRTDHLNIGGSLGLNLDGQNMVAHVWDGGPTRTTHQEFDGAGGNNRVSINDGVTSLNGNSFHAQHVTGTIVASGFQPAAKGMAPQASALTHDWNNDLAEATAEASAGMLISNHSYGYSWRNQSGQVQLPAWYGGAYIDDSRDWDNLQYNSPYYLMVVAAGNDGNDNSANTSPLGGNSSYDKLTGHSTSKNNMVVANGQDANVNNDGSFNSVSIAGSSSEGPTDDLRIKPDITGNGSGVYSTYDNADNAYNSISGTSMASPNVAGTLLLLQQHYNNVNGNYMRAATLKGLALHTADDAGNSGPDAIFGWGLLNAKRAAESISDEGNGTVIDELTLSPGQTYTTTVNSDGSNPLMASISWTDPAGVANTGTTNLSTPVLVNDLDIRLSNGNTYSPYRLTGVTTNNKGDNNVDPYERVDVSGASGSYTITVTHKGSLSGGSQDFSLVVTGVAGTPPVCNATTPSGVNASNVGTTTATVGWSAVANTTYDVRYRVVGGSWTTVSAGSISTNLSGLASGTQYEVQVRSVCPDNSTSAYSSTVSFTTGTANLSCATTISTFPYSEGFESNDGWTQVGGDDGNWVRDASGTPSSNTGPSAAVQGSFYMFLEASTNSSAGQIGNNATAILESACLDLSSVTGATFSFQNHMYGSNVGSITIQASNDGASWSNLWTLSGNQGNQWNAVDVDLSAYVGGDVKVRIVGTTGDGWSSDIAVDDLSVTTIGGGDTDAPTAPSNLTASNIEETTLTLNWNASSDNVGVTGYDVYQGASNLGTVTGTSANITGLVADTDYTFSVVAKDAAGNESAASASLDVTTAGGSTGGCTASESLPYSQGFESNDGWTQVGGDDGNWVRDANGTPSSNTGPSSAVEGSFYMFLEASSNSSAGQIGSNATAILESGCFDLSGESTATFGFQHHMYGNNVGSITVQGSSDGVTWTNLWTESGNQGNTWNDESVDLAAYVGGTVQLRIVGTTGNGWSSDIAIDDLSVTAGGSTGGGTTTVSLTLTFDDYPEETSWEIRDGSTVVASGGTYASQADGSTIVVDVPLSVGCYDFVISDVYGDGICCTYGNGSYSLSDGSSTLASGGSFGSSETSAFCVGGATSSAFGYSIASSVGQPTRVEMYPNPAVRTLNLASTRNESTFTITNMMGQIVSSGEVVNGKVDVSEISSGMYMIQLLDKGGKSLTKKFVKR
ncbi:MAG: S8 family serine peptidase [Ekhidna sp.]